MSSIVDKLNLISSTMDKLFDYVAQEERVGKAFEEYLEKNGIEISTQSQLSDVLMSYLLDTKGVLDDYKEESETLKALKDNFCSVFEVKSVGKNSFEAYSLTNEKTFTLFPLVKMTNLRSVCRGDYIRARIIKLENEYFILEIFNVMGASRIFAAQREAVRCLIQSPKCAYWQNDEMYAVIEKSAKNFSKKFVEYFGKSVISTTNKNIDELLEYFNYFYETGHKKEYGHLIEKPEKYIFTDLNNTEDEDFVESAIVGFAHHKDIYDAALFADKNYGIFVIPFYETMLQLKDENAVRYLIESSKNPPSLVLELSKKDGFLKAVNNALNKGLSENIKEVGKLIEQYKYEDFSPITVLYNSKVFSQMLGYQDETEIDGIGRNEPCPCGSGKKFKKCCIT